jgi:hypothetical protein
MTLASTAAAAAAAAAAVARNMSTLQGCIGKASHSMQVSMTLRVSF